MSPLQHEALKLFAKYPEGIPFSDLGNYLQTTMGSVWHQHWVSLRQKGGWRVVLNREGRQALNARESYLANLSLERKHPNERLSQRIEVAVEHKRGRVRKVERNTKKPAGYAEEPAASIFEPTRIDRGALRRKGLGLSA